MQPEIAPVSGVETDRLKQIEVRYFAILRDERGLGREMIETEAASPGELFEELRARHGFSLEASHFRVAINDEFAAWGAPLHADDRVVFIPPVAGG